MPKKLYPIKFYPILKERIWGGEKLKSLINKQCNLETIGESWELSDLEGDISVVANGALKGKTLRELLVEYKSAMVGDKIYSQFGNKFPLLIKFIDAKKDLSIQLHPNDKLAKERHDSFGKTEMWYVMDAESDAKLIVDFKSGVTLASYLKNLKEKTLPNILNFEKVKKGDAYFIETGRVHAIGAGVLLAEIQQTSDITYRIYDWDRLDTSGISRELHTELAMDAINFNMEKKFKATYSKIENETNPIINCPYFTTSYLAVTKTISKANNIDSFLIYICVRGRVTISGNNVETYLKTGETVLVPASVKDIIIQPEERTELLEVYIK